jgi:hypothetical protein
VNEIGNPGVGVDERTRPARYRCAPGRCRRRVLRARAACRIARLGRSDPVAGRQSGPCLAHQHAFVDANGDSGTVTDSGLQLVVSAVFFFCDNNYDNNNYDDHSGYDDDNDQTARRHHHDHAAAANDDHDHAAVWTDLLLVRRAHGLIAQVGSGVITVDRELLVVVADHPADGRPAKLTSHTATSSSVKTNRPSASVIASRYRPGPHTNAVAPAG